MCWKQEQKDIKWKNWGLCLNFCNRMNILIHNNRTGWSGENKKGGDSSVNSGSCSAEGQRAGQAQTKAGRIKTRGLRNQSEPGRARNQQRSCLWMDTEVTQRWCDWVLGTAQVWETHSQGVEAVTDPKNFVEPMKVDRCWGVGSDTMLNSKCRYSHFSKISSHS